MPDPMSSTEQAHWFATEIQPHERELRAWLRGRFPSLHDVDDLVQETYARIFRARTVIPINAAKAYLFSTARNLALNQIRHRHYERPETLGEIDPSRVLDDAAAAPEKVARAQELELLHEALQSLPERCREVFTLRRIHGLSQKEIAARLDISEKTVEAQCVIAMRKCVEYFRRADQAAPAPQASSKPVAPARLPVAPASNPAHA